MMINSWDETIAALTAEVKRLQGVCAEGARAFDQLLSGLPTNLDFGQRTDRFRPSVDRLWEAARGRVPEHSYGCALPTRGGVCDCGADPDATRP